MHLKSKSQRWNQLSLNLGCEPLSSACCDCFLEFFSRVFFSRFNLPEVVVGISTLPGSAINYSQKGLPGNSSKTKIDKPVMTHLIQ